VKSRQFSISFGNQHLRRGGVGTSPNSQDIKTQNMETIYLSVVVICVIFALVEYTKIINGNKD
jgi:hypothetical protein|tara:strand:+ start:307 stop:495 length:189 start_codon:yes stop_codon:yes gene_type:complete